MHQLKGTVRENLALKLSKESIKCGIITFIYTKFYSNYVNFIEIL